MKRSLTVICNFNGKDLLAKCLDSLKPELGDTDDVLVVENGSSDGSVEFIKKEFSWVKLLELPKNLGFTGGNNAALRYKDKYEYFVLLNNDIEVEPGFLDALLEPLEIPLNPPLAKGGRSASPSLGNEGLGEISPDIPIGITNAVILTADGKSVDHAGGRWLSFLSATNIGEYRGADPSSLPKEIFDTTYASGAALVIRTKLLTDGLFPDFFAYYEDVDLSWRVQRAGYRIVVTPRSRVRHLGSATSGKNRPLFEYYAARNRIWLFRRNLPAWQKLLVLPILIVARLLLLLPSLGNGEILVARTKGLWAGIIERPVK